jgi:hypothetical protein
VNRWLSVLLLLLVPASQAAQGLQPEVKVGTAAILDYEFDWGRDGRHCSLCNSGAGNSRLAYVDSSGTLWVGAVDPATGNFLPADGRGSLIDTLAAGPGNVGNGPEWAVSQRGSEIVYTRWIAGMPKTKPNTNLGFARQKDGVWIAGPVKGTQDRLNPGASLTLGDSAPRVAYANSDRSELYWRDMNAGSTESVVLTPYLPGTSVPRRWVEGTRDLILTAPAAPDATGAIHTQVFLFHSATGLMEQLTFDALDKVGAFMWSAPEFGGSTVFFTVAGGSRIDVYRQRSGTVCCSSFDLINTIAMPPDTPYLGTPGLFVHNGASWIFFWASADAKNESGPSRIGLTGIDPAHPSLRMLTEITTPARSRRDPEYFITSNGPYIYYNRFAPAEPGGAMRNEGIYRVDTSLGPRHD